MPGPAGRAQLLLTTVGIMIDPMNLGLQEMIFILVLALVLVGPRKLPEVARQLGKFLAEFKRASNEFRSQIETEMLNIELEERSKKQQEGPKVLPPEQPWERAMRPITDSVSRAKSELVSIANPDSEPVKTIAPQARPIDQPSSSSKAVETD
ncbi:MAG: twin-arginine translocase TatA/TatE family subunit [Candidatus Korobacteraceae bacterium]